MGLDLVELVMAVEERFGITLSDEDAVRAETPRQLIELIYSQVGNAGSGVCLTSRAFYSVRKTMMELFEWHRSEVRPAARLEDLVPRAGRREHWLRLRAGLQAERWEPLKRPAWLVGLIWVVCGALLVSAIKLRFDGVSSWITVPGGLVILWLVMLATRPLCVEIPRNLATVGQLTRWLIAYGPKLPDEKDRRWCKADVAAAVRELTIAELGIRPETYDEDAHFVKDLGAS